MGTFTFKWPHAAEEVYVTGTFDNWSKSEKLEKVGDHFEKTVTLPEATEAIFYKFVVDGSWTTDHTAPQAKDLEGNVNNLLKPEDIAKTAPPMAEVMNTVAPEATTVGLAKDVPFEEKKDAHVEEKTDAPAEEKKDAESSTLPGTFPETPAADQNKQFSVNPLPATEGAVNPVKLDAGEKVPKSITSNGIHDHVTLDKESYEKSDRIPGLVSPSDMAPVTMGNIIPESSLPVVSGSEFLTNSAAADSSTAALAAKVPLEENKAPEVVKESQEKADEEVGASGMDAPTGEKVDDKAKVEDELLNKVSEAPSTSEGTSGKGTDKTEGQSFATTITEGATAAGVTLLAAGLAAKDAIMHAAQSDTAQSAAQKVSDAATSAKDTVVAGTQSAAQQATDAAISAKDTVVASTQSGAQQASDATISAKNTAVGSTQSAAQQATDSTISAKDTVVATALSAVDNAKVAATEAASDLPESVKNVLPASVQEAIPVPPTEEEIKEKTIESISPEVPVEVKESIAESGQGPEATTNTAAVEQKTAVESELLKEVSPVEAFNEKHESKPADNVPSEVKDSITEAGKGAEAASSSTAVDQKTAMESELLKEVKPVESYDQQPKPAEAVPEEVKDSIAEAGRAPEAASSSTAVDQKTAMESELLKEVKPVESYDQQPKPAEAVPEEVKDSIAEAGKAPEAASSSTAVEQKTAVESELLKEVETTKPIDEEPREKTLPTETTNTSVESKLLDGAKQTLGSVDGKPKVEATTTDEPKAAEAAPHTDVTTPAVVPLIAKAEPAAEPAQTETKTEFPTKVTNGSESTPSKPAEAPSTPSKAETPARSTATPGSSTKPADSPSTAEKKKKHRLSSFFSKIKEKVASKDKP